MTDENTNEGNDEGTETNTTGSLFDKTNEATARLEAANKETKELLNRQEELYAKQKLGGNSKAGEPEVEEKSAEQTASEKRIQRIGEAGGAQWAKKE